MHIKKKRARTQQICELTCTFLEKFQAVARAMNGKNEMPPAWLFSFGVSRGGAIPTYIPTENEKMGWTSLKDQRQSICSEKE